MIRNVWAVARNFTEHAREMGNEPPKEPIFFLKAGSCIIDYTVPISLPVFSSQVEYELEIAIELGAFLMPEHICLALDLTARDIQIKMVKQGLPWTLSKSFPHACPIGLNWPFPGWDKLQELSFSLEVGGKKVQEGHVRDMVFSPEKLHSYLLGHFPARAGDLLLLGTPSGITKATSGDHLKAYLTGYPPVEWSVK